MTRGHKQRNLAIYLIKQGIADHRDIANLGQTTRRSVRAAEQPIGQLYLKATQPKPPAWLSFFDRAITAIDLANTSTAALLFTGVRRRTFVVAFGYGRLLLKPSVVEDDFGIKVTLNAVDHNKIKSIDRLTLDSAVPHSQIQAATSTNITDFGLDIDQDLLRAVTGNPRDETLGTRLSGKDALHVTGPITINDLPALLGRYLAEYRKNDYKEHFPWVDHIHYVNDSSAKSALDELVLNRIKDRQFGGIWLSVPERIEWERIQGFTYQSNGPLLSDVHIQTFLDSLRNPDTLSIDALKHRHYVTAPSNENDAPAYEWTVYRCLYAEVPYKAQRYLLNNGQWYRIDRNFQERIETAYNNVPARQNPLPAFAQHDEQAYNRHVADTDGRFANMDRQLIRHPERGDIEFCDLYTTGREMIHVKRYGGSSPLSHLFAQGTVSGNLFFQDADFRNQVNTALPATHQIQDTINPPQPGEYSITFAIISKSARPLTIPFFSKVTLTKAVKDLRNRGYKVALAKIPTAR